MCCPHQAQPSPKSSPVSSGLPAPAASSGEGDTDAMKSGAPGTAGGISSGSIAAATASAGAVTVSAGASTSSSTAATATSPDNADGETTPSVDGAKGGAAAAEAKAEAASGGDGVRSGPGGESGGVPNTLMQNFEASTAANRMATAAAAAGGGGGGGVDLEQRSSGDVDGAAAGCAGVNGGGGGAASVTVRVRSSSVFWCVPR